MRDVVRRRPLAGTYLEYANRVVTRSFSVGELSHDLGSLVAAARLLLRAPRDALDVVRLIFSHESHSTYSADTSGI